jgi:catechol 2,3-dioxygenase-like lactoylglutathione lyase family enzyme
VIALHHVQVACPAGGEDDARRFYGAALGLTEVGKPRDLQGRGGAWFRAYDVRGSVTAELHVGVEDPFAPARKAHPAFVVDDLERVVAALAAGGFEVDLSQEHSFAGHRRVHTYDPHGNRVEMLQPEGGSATEQAREPAAAAGSRELVLRVPGAPLVARHPRPDLRDVLAAAGPGGVTAHFASDRAAHGDSWGRIRLGVFRMPSR